MAGDTYLGFDFGLRRIGVAVGETITATARPLTTLAVKDGQPNWDQLQALLEEWRPTALVVGLPRHIDGTAAAVTMPAERFARRLHGRYGLPVHTIDEHLSSHAAEQELAQRGRGGKRLQRQKEQIDSLAAAVILETWFAERRHD